MINSSSKLDVVNEVATLNWTSHLGIAAFYEQRLQRVNDEDNELDHLQLGEVALPPEVRLDPGAQS